MMVQSKQKDSRRDPPLQFRPGTDLDHLVVSFAEEHSLPLSVAYKHLIALASAGLDLRFYSLVQEMAEVLEGRNAFVRACVHIHAALSGAFRVRSQFSDHMRASFIWQTARDFLAARGHKLRNRVPHLHFPRRAP